MRTATLFKKINPRVVLAASLLWLIVCLYSSPLLVLAEPGTPETYGPAWTTLDDQGNPLPGNSNNTTNNAEQYRLLAPLPGTGPAVATNDLGKYLNAILRTALIVGAVLAVLMFTVGGFMYMTGEAIGTKEAGKERMLNSIYGLLLLLGSYLILNTINPQLVKIDLSIQRPPQPMASAVTPPPEATVGRPLTKEEKKRLDSESGLKNTTAVFEVPETRECPSGLSGTACDQWVETRKQEFIDACKYKIVGDTKVSTGKKTVNSYSVLTSRSLIICGSQR